MTDNVALGRQGEIFVMRKIMDRGWKFPDDATESLCGLDWVFQKGDRKIKIQVKTSLRKYPNMNFSSLTFDYLTFTDLKDIIIIPKEIMSLGKVRITKTFKRLSNKFDLLDFAGTKLLGELLDARIPPSEFINTGNVFFGHQNNVKEDIVDKRLKV